MTPRGRSRPIGPFGVALACLFLAGASGGGSPAQTAVFQLRIPELDVTVEGTGAAELARNDFSSFEIGIRKTDLDFGAIHSKINTESADIVMTTISKRAEIVCRFDLTLRAGFQMKPGRNSVEISFEDRRGRLYYASFLLKDRAVGQYHSPAAPLKTVSEKYAVVVGISKYAHRSRELEDLQYAARDALAFREFLVSPGGGGYKEQNIRILTDEQATLVNIRTALFTFLTKPQEEDLVVIYFAGHGMADPNDPRQLYLLAHDSEFRNMGGTALLMSDFQDVFARILKPKQVVTFADACHSQGISGALFGGGSGENNLINQYLARASGVGERAVITASDISELSFESSDWGQGHGVFTYHLLEGLRGAADFDQDGTVVAGELFQYVQSEVRKATAGNQNPSVVGGLAESLPLSGFAGSRRAGRAAPPGIPDFGGFQAPWLKVGLSPKSGPLLQSPRFPETPSGSLPSKQ